MGVEFAIGMPHRGIIVMVASSACHYRCHLAAMVTTCIGPRCHWWWRHAEGQDGRRQSNGVLNFMKRWGISMMRTRELMGKSMETGYRQDDGDNADEGSSNNGGKGNGMGGCALENQLCSLR